MRDTLRKAAWRVAPGAMADRAHRYQYAWSAHVGVRQASERVAAAAGDTVARGPFAGMRYPAWRVASLAKRVGAYERELYSWFEEALEARPTRFVDIGAADGFYAVGMARRGVPVDAFELARSARREIRDLAKLNGVQVTVYGRATEAALLRLDFDGALVLCDCEGAEVDLLTRGVAERMARATVIVEVHDFLRSGAEQLLRERFAATHAIDLVRPVDREPDAFPELEALEPELRRGAIVEARTGSTPWLRMFPSG
jgi:hypothetical protein